jgi:hypothetical protein
MANKRLSLGFWISEDGALHVSIPELLERFGWPDDAEHRAQCEEIVKDIIRNQYPNTPIEEVD